MILNARITKPANTTLTRLFTLATVLSIGTLLSACNTISAKEEACALPEGYNLEAAFNQIETALTENRRQCAPQFDNYWRHLLLTAEGKPDNDNKRRFSEFLLRISDDGVISQRQAQDLYNRYFNVKFVSLIGDYNICSQACPVRSSMLADMEQELADKQLGLLKVSSDRQSFQRANRLLQESELLLEATCASCSAES